MVSAGQVNSHLSEITSQIKNYSSIMEGLSGSWTGPSHDSIEAKASAFASEFSAALSGQMGNFATACDLYQQYETCKQNIAIAQSNYNQAVASKDNSSASHYSSEISSLQSKLTSLKGQIESCLSSVCGIKLEATSNGASAATTASASTTSSGGSIEYKTTRFANTTVWYTVIPKDMMPNLAVAHDDYSKVTSEVPTAIAQRKGAKLGINFCVTGDSMGLIYTDGKLVRKSNTNSGETLYMTQDGQLNAVPNSKYNTNDILNLNPVWASKGFYSIIKDGKYINWNTDLAKARHPRTFIGQDYDGNYIVGVCTGRRDNEAGWTLKDVYDFVTTEVSSNVRFLYNADGGGSSAFVYDGQKLNPNTDKSERARPDLIYWT